MKSQIELEEISRTLVLWYIKDEFGKDSSKEHISINEAFKWLGLKVWYNGAKYYAVKSTYQFIVDDLLKLIGEVKLDISDGIQDEINEVKSILEEVKFSYIKERAKNIYKSFKFDSYLLILFKI